MQVRTLLIIALPLFSTGCSSYIYKTETAGFSTGVDELKKAHQAAIAGLVSDRESSFRQSAIEARAAVSPSPDCPSNKPSPDLVGLCTLIGQARGTTPDEIKESIAVQQQASVALQWLSALADYGAALTAITDATDRAALVDAQGKLAASVKALAKQRDDAVVAKAKAGDTKAAATPLIGDGAAASVNLIASAANAILDRQRLQALREAVDQADGPVQILAGYIGEEQVILQDNQRADLSQFATELTVGLGPTSAAGTYEKQLDQAIAVTQKIDAVAGTNPKQAATKMAEAHGALRDAIASGKGQDLAAIELVTEFVAAATAVHDGFAKTAGGAAAGS